VGWWLAGLALIVGIAPVLLLYRPSYVVIVGDTFLYWIDALRTVPTDLQVWDRADLGQVFPWGIFFPYALLWWIPARLGWDLSTAQLFVHLVLSASGVGSMLWLARIAWPNRPFAPFFAAIFYALNFMNVLVPQFYVWQWTAVFLPVGIAAYILFCRACERDDATAAVWWGVSCAGALCLAFAILSANPPTVVPVAYGLVASGVARTIQSPARLRIALHTAWLAGLALLLSLWWLAPDYFYWAQVVGGSSVDPQSYFASFLQGQGRSSFLNNFRLNPFWAWSAEYFSYTDR